MSSQEPHVRLSLSAWIIGILALSAMLGAFIYQHRSWSRETRLLEEKTKKIFAEYQHATERFHQDKAQLDNALHQSFIELAQLTKKIKKVEELRLQNEQVLLQETGTLKRQLADLKLVNAELGESLDRLSQDVRKRDNSVEYLLKQNQALRQMLRDASLSKSESQPEPAPVTAHNP
jgi:hypothetical protein